MASRPAISDELAATTLSSLSGKAPAAYSSISVCCQLLYIFSSHPQTNQGATPLRDRRADPKDEDDLEQVSGSANEEKPAKGSAGSAFIAEKVHQFWNSALTNAADEVRSRRYAFPLNRIRKIMQISDDDIKVLFLQNIVSFFYLFLLT